MSFVPDSNIDGTPITSNSTGGGGGGGITGTVTIGTTVIPVGGSTTFLEGLSYVSATIFNGNLNGTATLSDRSLVAHSAVDTNDYITFTSTRNGSAQINTSDLLRYNPNTGTLTVSTISATANLSLNPVGNIALNNKELLQTGTINSTSALILTAATSGTAVVTPTPDRIDLGSSIADSVDSTKLKLIIFNSGTDVRGIGVFSNSQIYKAPVHSFFNTVREQLQVGDIVTIRPDSDIAGIQLLIGAITAGATTSATPTGISLGSGVSTGLYPKLQLLSTTTEQIGLGVTSGRSDYITSSFRTHSFWIGTSNPLVLTNASLDLFTLSTGSLNIGNPTVVATVTPSRINLGGSIASDVTAFPKVQVFNNGTLLYGLGASETSLNYITNNSARHEFWIDRELINAFTPLQMQLLTGDNKHGIVLQTGNSDLTASTTPNSISLGAGVSNTAGLYLKLLLFDNRDYTYGFGVSQDRDGNYSLDYTVNNMGYHTFYVESNTEVFRISRDGLVFNPVSGAAVITGLQSLSTATLVVSSIIGELGNINFNNAQLLNINSISTTSLAVSTITGPVTFNGNWTFAGGNLSGINTLTATTGNITNIVTNQISRTTGNLIISVAAGANVNFSNRAITSVLSITVTTVTATTVSASTSVTTATVSTTNLITAGANNLVINPGGTTVNFSNKLLINIASLTATTGSFTTATIPTLTVNTLTTPNAAFDFSNKNFINVGTVTLTTLTANSVNTPSISSTGNITINPLTSVSFSGKNITDVGVFTGVTLNATSAVFTTLNVQTITSPANLSLNPTGPSVDFNNKSLINVAGFTVGNATITNLTTTNILSTNLTINALSVDFSNADLTNIDAINAGSILLSGNITAASVTTPIINSPLSTISFSNKVLTDILSAVIPTLITSIIISDSTSPNIVIAPAGVVDFSNRPITNISSVSAATATLGSLNVGPVVATTISGTNLTLTGNVSAMTGSITTLTTNSIISPELNLFIGTAPTYGGNILANNANISGVSLLRATTLDTDTLVTELITTLGSGGTDLNINISNALGAMVLNNRAITGVSTLSTQRIITATGNLVLEPAGTAVDFSNVDIINVTNITTVNATVNSTLTTTLATVISSLTVPAIFTASGNLLISPTGPAVNFTGKNLINISDITASGTVSAATGSYNNLFVNNIYSAVDLNIAPTGDNILFNGKNLLNANTLTLITSIRVPTITSTGDLSIFPDGTNVNFNLKNLTNVANIIATSIIVPQITTTATLSINTGAGGVVLNAVPVSGVTQLTATVGITTPAIASPATLSIVSGNNTVTFGNSSLSAINTVTSSTVTTSTITAPGFLVINPLSGVDFSAKNIFNIGGITANSLSTPSITSTTNLSINPVGNVNFNNKTLVNIGTFTVGTVTIGQINSIADLVLNPTGSVNFSNRPVINVSTLTAGSVNTALINPGPATVLVVDAQSTNFSNRPVTGISSLSVGNFTLTANTISNPNNIVINPLASVSFSNKELVDISGLVATTASITNISNTNLTTQTIIGLGNIIINANGGIGEVQFSGGSITNIDSVISDSLVTNVINVTAIAGNLGTIDFSGSTLTNVTAIQGVGTAAVRFGTTAVNQGYVLRTGSLTATYGTASLTPTGIDLGSDIGNGGSTLKLRIAGLTTGIGYGLTVSANSLDYYTDLVTTRHTWYAATTQLVQLSTSGLALASTVPVTTISGPLVVTSANGTVILRSGANDVVTVSGTTATINNRNTYGGIAVTNNILTGTGAGNIFIQCLPQISGLSAFMAINFNGSFDGTQVRNNTNKLRWRMLADQNSTNDQFQIDSFNGTVVTPVMLATRRASPNAHNIDFSLSTLNNALVPPGWGFYQSNAPSGTGISGTFAPIAQSGTPTIIANLINRVNSGVRISGYADVNASGLVSTATITFRFGTVDITISSFTNLVATVAFNIELMVISSTQMRLTQTTMRSGAITVVTPSTITTNLANAVTMSFLYNFSGSCAAQLNNVAVVIF